MNDNSVQAGNKQMKIDFIIHSGTTWKASSNRTSNYFPLQRGKKNSFYVQIKHRIKD